MMKKFSAAIAAMLALCVTLSACSRPDFDDDDDDDRGTSKHHSSSSVSESSGGSDEDGEYDYSAAMEIVAGLTLEQKAAQMLQPAIYNLSEEDMKKYCFGSILSTTNSPDYLEWRQIVDGYQRAALASEAGIPYIYGQDDVHGVNYSAGAVIFPHNIGIGAANDPDLTYQMGLATADEALLCHMVWNFAPCLAQSVDPRWGRTYESYGSSLDIITSLGTAYTKGLIDGGIIACAKHFFGDGNVTYGTGEKSDADRIIDRGDSSLTASEIDALLAVYQAQIDAGAQTIMISHSSLNGVKMHENAQYIMMLKNEMGFKGFIVSDWESVQNISPKTYREQIITAVNAGIDMLMEPNRFMEAMDIIVSAVNGGDIEMSRVDDAVTRIIQVKINIGLMDDPFCEKMPTVKSSTGSDEYRALAEKLVEKSLVLVKNKRDILPFDSGTKVYITGPAADNANAQCGGWTLAWNGSPSKDVPGVTTLLQGFKQRASTYGITIVDDPKDADVVLLAVGEQAYAEWYGDTTDLQLCGALGLSGNSSEIERVKKLGKPVVACIIAGRQVIINDYVDDWDAVVMCYLPGSEGQGIADVLCGGAEFSGKLPSPWYSDIRQIGTGNAMLPDGFGLRYGDPDPWPDDEPEVPNGPGVPGGPGELPDIGIAVAELDGHIYAVFDEGLSWDLVERRCTEMGGHLISINSEQEQVLAVYLAKMCGKDNIWTGGYYDKGAWHWTDGSRFSYTNWDHRPDDTDPSIELSQPDNYSGYEFYIRFPARFIQYQYWYANEGGWNDTANEGDDDAPMNSFGFICEWESESAIRA